MIWRDTFSNIPLAKVNCFSCLVEYNSLTYEYIGKPTEDLIIGEANSSDFGRMVSGAHGTYFD